MTTKQEELKLRIDYIKLKRIQQYNERLEEMLSMKRLPALVACDNMVKFAQEQRDYLVGPLWNMPEEHNRYKRWRQRRLEDVGCCTIM